MMILNTLSSVGLQHLRGVKALWREYTKGKRYWRIKEKGRLLPLLNSLASCHDNTIAMTILSHSYATLKKETGVEFARKAILETYKHLGNNVKKTSQALKCSRNTVYLALKKQNNGCLTVIPAPRILFPANPLLP